MTPIDSTEDVFKKLGIDPTRRPPPEPGDPQDMDRSGTESEAQPRDREPRKPTSPRPPLLDRPPAVLRQGLNTDGSDGQRIPAASGPGQRVGAHHPGRPAGTSLSQQWKARVAHRDREQRESITLGLLLLVTLWSMTAAALAWSSRAKEPTNLHGDEAEDAARATVYLAALGAEQSAAREGGFPSASEGTWMDGVVDYRRVPIGFEISVGDLAYRNGGHRSPFRDALDRILAGP